MNSESLGHYFYGQSKADSPTKIKAANNHQLQTESGCSKGVCEVAWKPLQTSAGAQKEQSDLSASAID
jgi:hypothetical protein